MNAKLSYLDEISLCIAASICNLCAQSAHVGLDEHYAAVSSAVHGEAYHNHVNYTFAYMAMLSKLLF